MTLKTLLKPIYHTSMRSVVETWKDRTRVHQAYHKILKNPDTNPLTPAQERRINEYAREVLGSAAYRPWLRNYTAYRGEFVEGWIPGNFFTRTVLPVINGNYRYFGQARTLSRRIFGSDLFPDRVYYVNGAWFSADGTRLSPSQVREVTFQGSDRAFLKQEATSQGRGITVLTPQTFEDMDYSSLGNFVIQEAVEQHEWFDRIFSGAVATVRITTVMMKGRYPEARACYLRLGRGGSNFVVSTNAIRVPIADAEGTLGAFASDTHWIRHRHHPDTGVHFGGEKIPYFKETVAACIALHCKVPQFGVIGWDTVTTPLGRVEIMEWNTKEPTIAFCEAATGPCFTGLGWENLRAE